MTNKINGIDVSECKYYHYKGCTANNFGKCDSSSEIYKNCYFKQLKRLQEENEKLKARLKTLDDEVSTIEITPDEFERYKKYKQALEIIREITEENIIDCAGSKCEGMEEIQTKINEVLEDIEDVEND